MQTLLNEDVQDAAALSTLLYDWGQRQEWLAALGAYQFAAEQVAAIGNRPVADQPAALEDRARQKREKAAALLRMHDGDRSEDGKIGRAQALAMQTSADAMQELAARLASIPATIPLITLTYTGPVGCYYVGDDGRYWASFWTGAPIVCSLCGAKIASGYTALAKGEQGYHHICASHTTHANGAAGPDGSETGEGGAPAEQDSGKGRKGRKEI